MAGSRLAERESLSGATDGADLTNSLKNPQLRPRQTYPEYFGQREPGRGDVD